MPWLSDEVLARLRAAAELPDLGDTKYRLLQGLARGGMGAVYLAEDTSLHRRVALKVLDLPDPTGDLAARMLREARILARLEHPGIVPVHDVGSLPDGRVFYTMKFVEGRRLDHHLQHVPSLPDRLRIFVKLCEAVAFAHAHAVLHRDLKPENVMVGPFGEVLVMDWGVAKILRDSPFAHSPRPDDPDPSAPTVVSTAPPPSHSSPRETAHGAVLGTPGYMAPEQARGEIQQLTPCADVFSLGAILRFLLTGRSPLDATTAGAAHPSPGDASQPAPIQSGPAPHPPARPDRSGARSIPRPLRAICAMAMAQDPAARYPSAQDLAADVARYLDGLPVLAYPEGLFGRARRLAVRHRVALFIILAYIIARALMLTFLGG